MINAKQFVHMLALCLTATLGYAQDRDSEYVTRVHPVPIGVLSSDLSSNGDQDLSAITPSIVGRQMKI